MLVMSYILVVSNRYSNSCAVLYVLSIQYLLTGGFQDLVIGSGYHPVVLSAWAFLVGAWQCACRHPVYYFDAYVAMSLIIQSRWVMFSRRWTGRPSVCVWVFGAVGLGCVFGFMQFRPHLIGLECVG